MPRQSLAMFLGSQLICFSIDKPDDAAYILERLIEANANARLRLSLANTYYRAGRTDEADKLVNELMVEAWRYPVLVSSLRRL
jgi:hypothetical protein